MDDYKILKRNNETYRSSTDTPVLSVLSDYIKPLFTPILAGSLTIK